MDMPADKKLEMEKEEFRDPNFIVLNALEPGAKVRGLKPISDGGVSYDALEVMSPEGDVYTLLLDPKSHQLTKLQYAAEQQQIRDELGDYRVIDGISFPFKLKHEAGPQKVEIEYDKIVVNPKIASDAFN
jgi:hypothetical protein